MTYYHKKSSPVPWIAAIVLLGGFIALVVHFSGDETEPEAFPPVARENWPPPAYEPPPREAPPVPEPETVTPPPPPEIELSPAQAERKLRDATLAWRAYAVKLCQKEQWPSARAVAFLEKVTWNDRDREKQHAHGLASIRTMLGTESADAVELAEALAEQGDLEEFFERNRAKLEADVEVKKEAVVLDDMWKPNRIRWGFPLDTPIEELREFKHVGLAVSLEAWRAFAVQHVRNLEIGDEAKMEMLRAAVGEGIRQREAKLRAGFRVLLEMPDASLRKVVEEFVAKAGGDDEKAREEFTGSLMGRVEAAMEAAAKAKGESS